MGTKHPNQNDVCFEISKKLPLRIYIAYGLGHVLNDVCAAMWFSYLLVFFHLVLKFDGSDAGILLLVGQVADAVATPFVGYNSDKDRDWWIYKFGKRKIWYFMGTVCVIATFPFIYSSCINCESSPRALQMIYYSFFIIIFQFGWASVQVAHMSLIPEITCNEHQRTRLAAIRNGGTVVASVLVYIITWLILNMSGGSNSKIGPDDVTKFQHIVWSVMTFGILCSILFYIFIKEPKVVKSGVHGVVIFPPLSFKELFLNYNLYFVATVYMSSRLFINLTQVFMSLYLSESLDMVASSLAFVPLAMYIASFVASFPVGVITKFAGRKLTYILGATLGIVGCLWIQWGQGEHYKTYFIFVVSVFLGCASTILLVSSLDITTDLIGKKTNQGAFIYGIMSFADKLSNGLAVKIIQDFHTSANVDFYRNVLTYVCGGALVLGSAAVLFVNGNRMLKRERQESSATISESLSE